jgi:hypothetical protein
MTKCAYGAIVVLAEQQVTAHPLKIASKLSSAMANLLTGSSESDIRTVNSGTEVISSNA